MMITATMTQMIMSQAVEKAGLAATARISDALQMSTTKRKTDTI
jgi:hypothetical protein